MASSGISPAMFKTEGQIHNNRSAKGCGMDFVHQILGAKNKKRPQLEVTGYRLPKESPIEEG